MEILVVLSLGFFMFFPKKLVKKGIFVTLPETNRSDPPSCRSCSR